MAARTPSQTVGPYFSMILPWDDGGTIAFAEAGKRIAIEGRVLDGAGAPIGDALIETWQLSPAGSTPASSSGDARPHGFGRVATAPDGTFRIETSMPAGAAPCLEVTILARGLMKALRTRVYIAPEAKVRAEPLLAAIATSPRLATLVAQPGAEGSYRWDVRLQGEGETVFFAA
jgi:protocatechuate 3,4-dioxygenase alpha subunit